MSKEQSVDLKLSPLSNKKFLEIDGSAPKAIPEDTSDVGLGEDGMPLNPNGGEPQVQFTSPGKDPGNGDAKVEIGAGGVPHFVGLGKEELMKYANDPFWVRLRWILFALFWIIWLAMLVGAIVIIVLAPKCATKQMTPAQNIVAKEGPYYQIVVKSFSRDRNFSGLEEKISYLKDLGVKTVILSQFLDTNGKGPAEVINFEAIDPSYGMNFEEFGKLVGRFSSSGLKILLQFIPNRSSRAHQWFKSRPDFYVLKKKSEVENSNWTTVYSDGKTKAWNPVNASDHSPDSLYYLHQFSENEAELNYNNPAVVKEMNSVMKKLYSTGVDGFLLSDVSYLTENLANLGSQESQKNQNANLGVIQSLVNTKDWELGTGRKGPYTLLDVDGLSTEETLDTYSKDSLIPVVADWATLDPKFNETQLREASESKHFILRRLSSPRLQRLVTRFGPRRANILALVSFLIRGEVVLYYGEELGLTSVRDKPTDALLDISTNDMDWIAADKDTSNRNLKFFKDLLNVHNSMNQSTNNGGATEYYISGPETNNTGIFAFRRDTAKKFVVLTNVGTEKVNLNVQGMFKAPTPDVAKVVAITPGLQSSLLRSDIPTANVTIPGESGIVLELLDQVPPA